MPGQEEFWKLFPRSLRTVLQESVKTFDVLQEIRLRTRAPVILIQNNQETILKKIAERTELAEIISYVSNYSPYAFEEEIRQGYLTVAGGHRVGLAGKTVVDNGKVRSIRNISCINIRLAHQKIGCADKILPCLFEGKRLFHTLLISPPGCGKTTLLRDLIRQISGGADGLQVGVVDERSELAACYLGVPQNDVGIRTDVLDACPKAEGMMMLLRSMAPDVIAVDEIGLAADVEAIRYVIGGGCKLIATVHGGSMEEVRNKPVLGELVRERVFERYILLSSRKGRGTVEGIYDSGGEKIKTAEIRPL